MSDGGGGNSKLEDDLLGRHIKKMDQGKRPQESGDVELQRIGSSDVLMEDTSDGVVQGTTTQREQDMRGPVKRIISYKAKLMGREEDDFDRGLDEQMNEWLKEEEEVAPVLSEEQRKMLGAIPSLQISDEKLKELCKPWRDALICTVLGRKTNLYMMRDRIKWLLRSDKFELIDLPNNYFVFRTNEKFLRSKLLFDGPWLIQGHYLAVQRWSPNFNPYCNKVRKVAVWIRIPTLPLHMYSEECLLEIGNLIGKTLKVDMNTLNHQENNQKAVERGKYARVSVEVDLNRKLQSRFILRNHVYPVEYEGLNVICFKCGLYGHTLDNCSDKLLTALPAAQEGSPETVTGISNKGTTGMEQPIVSIPGVSVEEEYGSWMQVKSNVRSRSRSLAIDRQNQTKTLASVRMGGKEEEKKGSGSRFNVLQQFEPDVNLKEAGKLNRRKEVDMQWRRKEQVNLSGKSGSDVKSVVDAGVGGKKQASTAITSFEIGETSNGKVAMEKRRESSGKDVIAIRESARKSADEKREKEVATDLIQMNGVKEQGKFKRTDDVALDVVSKERGQLEESVGPEGSAQLGQGFRRRNGKKGDIICGPKVASPSFKKKNQQGKRKHAIVIGSLAKNESLKWDLIIPKGKNHCEPVASDPNVQREGDDLTLIPVRPPDPNVPEMELSLSSEQEGTNEFEDVNIVDVEVIEMVDLGN